ncbi:MAG TPA: SMC-Scp complex subunit ScpB [Myxococcales bacterium]|nr:SMC-Scp complex subunit ScpB [Myxococcales bacterium]HIK86219.1 SMC-Scp complex subunit ScpB [Myxococcales bacterium]
MSRMESKEKRRIIEALVLSSPEPISAEKLAEIIPYCKPGQAKDLVNELNTEYAEQDRAFEIWEVAGGFQIRTRAEFSGYLQKLQKERALRLSPAALETLAIIAYRQPTTRAEIEEVRGVDAGATVRSLLERHLIRIAGQREVPGRPMLYGTTRRFLEVFGIENLKNLPSLRELDELAKEQGLLDPAADENAEAEAEASADAITEGIEVVESPELTETDSADVTDVAADASTDELRELDGGELTQADEMPDGEAIEQDDAISRESDGNLADNEGLTER